MTPVKTENTKCESTEDDEVEDEVEDEKQRLQFIKDEEVKCKVGNDRVKLEQSDCELSDIRCETVKPSKKCLRPPPKTAAERKRAQREREKKLKEELGLIRLKGPPKSAAERKRTQREREKEMRKQIHLLFPKLFEKMPGESRKERLEREKQLKLDLGLIIPKKQPKTAAERKRAQREREKQMKLEISLYGLQKAKKFKSLDQEKRQLLPNSAIHIRQHEDKKDQLETDREQLQHFMPKTQAPQKGEECRKELKPLSTNGPNVLAEIKSVLKSSEWLDHNSKLEFPTGENIKPVLDLEFVDCGKVISTDNPSVIHFMEE